MTDVLTSEQRLLNMSRIKGRDTKPELLIRRGLHARGLRYRLHIRTLPGSPDLVFSRFRTAVFIHGCFWHLHRCPLSKLPATRTDFWRNKLEENVNRDRSAIKALQGDGWRVLVVWECAMRGQGRQDQNAMLDSIVQYIRSGTNSLLELSGNRFV
jgi:DNA mismatch endonuclease (patch repair protein)